MAALTGHIGMRAVQNKAGTKVIKCRLRSDIFRREQTESGNRDQDQIGKTYLLKNIRHWIDLTSENESAVWQRPQSVPNSPS